MFSCQDIEAFIESIVDGEFDGQEHVEVNDHIAQCTPCRQLVQGRLNLKKLFVRALSVPAPNELKNRIFASLEGASLEGASLEDASSESASETPVTLQQEEQGRQRSASQNFQQLTQQDSSQSLFEKASSFGEASSLEESQVEAKNAPQSNKIATSSALLSNASDAHAPTAESSDADADSRQKSAFQRGALQNNDHLGKVALLLLAVAILFVAIIPQWTVAPATTEGLSVWEESVDWHRSDVPMEVSGPNVGGVAKWFHGKVNFDVDPLSFGRSTDAQLIGGRLASVHNRRAALLNYRVNGAHVTVLVFDGKGISVPSNRLQTFDNQQIAVMEGPGYDIALFHKNDLTYTITTDLPSSKFEHLIHQVLSSN